ncbi:MAG: CHC2 zinc finger domain-containing protein [Myxococcota bacterium]
MIPEHVLDTIRQRVSVVDLAVDLGARPSRPRNGKARCACIVHGGSNPTSMVLGLGVHRDGWHCFGCGAGGDVVDLHRAVTGAAFVDAVRDLATRAGVEVEA